MIAGEYAVLESDQQAIVVAVDRYIKATIESSEQNKLTLPQLGSVDITWTSVDNHIHFSVCSQKLSFVENTLTVFNQFLQEKSVDHLHSRPSQVKPLSLGTKIWIRLQCCSFCLLS